MDLASIAALLGAHRAHAGERIQQLWSGYGEIVRVRLEGGPVPSVVVKRVAPPPGEGAGHRRKLASYEVERAWYTGYAGRCARACRVPHVWHVSPGLFVLEDLDAAGFPGRTRSPGDAQLEACITWLAAFHRTFLGEDPGPLWTLGTYWHLGTRADEHARMAPGALKRAAPTLAARLREATPRTLVHGDAKLANFCFGAGVAAVDFQYVGGGIGVQDLVYLLGCLDDARLERDHAHWLDVYFGALDHPDAEAAWRPLVPTAWADFERFLAGWSPGHRSSRFAAAQTALALALAP